METRRWLNQSQPQTLTNATILLYLNAAFSLLFGWLNPLLMIVRLLGGVGAYGIANDQKWGYYLGIGAGVVPLAFSALRLVLGGPGAIGVNFLVSVLFEVVLVVLLLHPLSRGYQRIWFK